MQTATLIQAEALVQEHPYVLVDCRYSLADPDEGRALYTLGHIPGAQYLDLNRDMSGEVGQHGGRHPLPDPDVFARTLADIGISSSTLVVAYDDSGFAYAARLWWMMRSIGFRPPVLLDGGYQGWLRLGGEPEATAPVVAISELTQGYTYSAVCDIEGLRLAQEGDLALVDSRESRRYLGMEEPIDPVAGHIPGAVNFPWQEVTTEQGVMKSAADLQCHFSEVRTASEVIVYCGSGVTACVNIFAMSLAGMESARLYAGSWSDWCSYLESGD